MNIQRIVVGSCLFFSTLTAIGATEDKSASTLGAEATNKSSPTLNAIVSYRDFKYFQSTPNFDLRFNGHSNLYFVGGNNFEVKKDWTVGLFAYEMDTDINLFVAPFVNNTQHTHTNSLFVHVLKQVKSNFYIDTIGGMGQSLLHFTTELPGSTITSGFTSANTKNTNWFLMLKGVFCQSWGKFSASESVSGLYSQVNQSAYSYLYNPIANPLLVSPSTTRAGFILESGELDYNVKNNTNLILTGGLIQVLGVSGNNPATTLATIGSTPNIDINQNGFEVGAGISYQYKKALLRFDQQYSQRGSVYHSNMSILSLRLDLD